MAEIRKVFHCDYMREDFVAYYCPPLKLTCQSMYARMCVVCVCTEI